MRFAFALLSLAACVFDAHASCSSTYSTTSTSTANVGLYSWSNAANAYVLDGAYYVPDLQYSVESGDYATDEYLSTGTGSGGGGGSWEPKGVGDSDRGNRGYGRGGRGAGGGGPAPEPQSTCERLPTTLVTAQAFPSPTRLSGFMRLIWGGALGASHRPDGPPPAANTIPDSPLNDKPADCTSSDHARNDHANRDIALYQKDALKGNGRMFRKHEWATVRYDDGGTEEWLITSPVSSSPTIEGNSRDLRCPQ